MLMSFQIDALEEHTIMKKIVHELNLQRKEFAKDALEFKNSSKGSSFKSRVKVLSGDDGILARECKAVLYWMWRDQRSSGFDY